MLRAIGAEVHHGTHFALRSKRKTKFVIDLWFVLVVKDNRLCTKILFYPPALFVVAFNRAGFLFLLKFFQLRNFSEARFVVEKLKY